MKRNKIFRFLRAPYTLVEMLVVMAIIAIVLGIGLPAFEKMVKGQGVGAGVRGIAGKLMVARAAAITNNIRTALIFPPSTASSAPVDLRNLQVRACEVTYDSTSGIYTFYRWIESEPWYKLPEGVVFDNLSSSFTIASVSFSDVTGSGAVTEDTPGIVFSPYGCVDFIPADKTIIVYENNGGVTTAAAAANKITITVRSFTGKTAYSED